MEKIVMGWLREAKKIYNIKYVHKINRNIQLQQGYIREKSIYISTPLLCGIVLNSVKIDRNKKDEFIRKLSYARIFASFEVCKKIFKIDETLKQSFLKMKNDLDRLDMSILDRFPIYSGYIDITGLHNDFYGCFFAFDAEKIRDTPDSVFEEKMLQLALVGKKTRTILNIDYRKSFTVYKGYDVTDAVAYILSVLLYISSENPDVDMNLIKNPPFIKTKKGDRLFFSEKPSVCEVGMNIGRRIRNNKKSISFPEERSAPRAHLRRAHWHTYRIGKGRVATKLRWLHPMLIGYKDLPDEAFT